MSDNVTDFDAAKKRALDGINEEETLSKGKAVIDPDSLAALSVGFPWRGMTWKDWGEYAGDDGLPPDCPVVPLGRDGGAYCLIDSFGHLRVMMPKEFTRNDIISLFDACSEYPKWFWPKTKYDKREKDEVPTGEFHADRVSSSIMQACSYRGSWAKEDKVRGVGAWMTDEGELALHVGDKVLIGGESHEAGEIGNYFYPKTPRVIAPNNNVAEPGKRLLKELNGWHYTRPELEPLLLLGWAMSALVGGALDVRPIIYIAGPRGNGKSSLMEFLYNVMGQLPFHTADTTAAAIRQTVGLKSIPVMLDESAEARRDNRNAKNILELVRVAYDGSSQSRGSSDHKAVEFRVRSSFLLASINRPGIGSQDRSRMAFVNLKQFPQDSKEPVWDMAVLREMGEGLLARWQQHYPNYRAVFDEFFTALREIGHDARGATMFGTLAACAHIAIHDDLPEDDDLRQWSDWLCPEKLAELTATETDADLCVAHMMTVTTRKMESFSRGKRTITDILSSWESFPGNERRDDCLNKGEVNKFLEQIGVKLIAPKWIGSKHDLLDCYLFVSSSLPTTAAIFADTHWHGNEGGQGTWIGALQNLGEDGSVWEAVRAKVMNRQIRGIKIRLAEVIELFDVEEGDDVDE